MAKVLTLAQFREEYAGKTGGIVVIQTNAENPSTYWGSLGRGSHYSREESWNFHVQDALRELETYRGDSIVVHIIVEPPEAQPLPTADSLRVIYLGQFRSEFRGRIGGACLIQASAQTERSYWGEPGCGNDLTREQAAVYTVERALNYTVGAIATGLAIHILQEPPPAPLPPPPVPVIRRMLDPELVKLLEAAPTNPQIRTQVLAKVLVPIPDEAQTFEAVSEWFEKSVWPTATTETAVAPPTAVRDLRIEVHCMEVVEGTCRFRGRQHATERITLTAAEISDLADESEDLDDFIDRIDAKAIELAREDAEFSAPDIERYYDEEVTHTVDSSAETQTRFRNAAIEILRGVDEAQYQYLAGDEMADEDGVVNERNE